MRRGKGLQQFGRFLFLAIVMVLIIFPVYWMINTSFKSNAEVFQRHPTFWPHSPTLAAYSALMQPTGTRAPFLQTMLNSLIAAAGATVLSVAIGICAAYALTRLRFPGRDTFSALVFGCYVFPGILLFIPIYIQFQQLGLLDTFPGLILAYQIFGIPFATWMLRSYFVTIPSALEEAARIDGCNRLQSIFYIVIPLAAPGIAASTIFTFTTSWNEFLFAQVLMQTPEKQTAQVAIYSLMNGDTLPWNQLMAASVLVGVPVLILYFGAQRFVGGGLTAGAVK
ncbi:multiple sugar transport system permease protein [Rhizobium sp. BK313]|jgi:multiple sugar transport system permease protein|uniref:carbohydrate ABC transporter permease n=1 Tax=Rhizobium sp. BK313 TaxID=2587081 RepID=UPI00105CE5D0|nr:carbohydrate ABC transporter permease [Rhizobium sp. BK313]MBB3457970.1 multiple sugar transport system permease protein [Rhizobium sp. BK313]